MGSELAKAIYNCTTDDGNGDIERIAAYLKKIGVTDDLVEQHKIANDLIGSAYRHRPYKRTHAHDNYVDAEKAAGRWEA